jgi:glucose-6-phosphate dehydrogenase assembly protein OpcA
MATTYRVLGQSALADMTETTVYTVPSATQAIVSSIVITNLSNNANLFRIAIRPSADSTTANKHYIAYNAEVAANTTTAFTLGITLSTGDKVLAYSIGPGTVINAYGSEIA